MNRWVLCLLTLHGCCAAGAFGDDYLLRLEAIGYVDQPASIEEPPEVCLHSIEVLARPGAPFHIQVKLDAAMVAIDGELRPKEDGSFLVPFHYRYCLDTGMTTPTESGKPKPVLDQSSMHSTVTIACGGRCTVAGSDSKIRQSGVVTAKSRIRYVMTLQKFDPRAK